MVGTPRRAAFSRLSATAQLELRTYRAEASPCDIFRRVVGRCLPGGLRYDGSFPEPNLAFRRREPC